MAKARLDALDFVWTIQDPRKKSWDEHLADLQQYKEEHGKWPSKNEQWRGIGSWMHNQRRAHANKLTSFTKERL